VVLLWHVVVIPLEPAARDPDTVGEVVEFLEGGVAHQV
jgi:hypothetical protein